MPLLRIFPGGGIVSNDGGLDSVFLDDTFERVPLDEYTSQQIGDAFRHYYFGWYEKRIYELCPISNRHYLIHSEPVNNEDILGQQHPMDISNFLDFGDFLELEPTQGQHSQQYQIGEPIQSLEPQIYWDPNIPWPENGIIRYYHRHEGGVRIYNICLYTNTRTLLYDNPPGWENIFSSAPANEISSFDDQIVMSPEGVIVRHYSSSIDGFRIYEYCWITNIYTLVYCVRDDFSVPTRTTLEGLYGFGGPRDVSGINQLQAANSSTARYYYQHESGVRIYEYCLITSTYTLLYDNPPGWENIFGTSDGHEADLFTHSLPTVTSYHWFPYRDGERIYAFCSVADIFTLVYCPEDDFSVPVRASLDGLYGHGGTIWDPFAHYVPVQAHTANDNISNTTRYYHLHEGGVRIYERCLVNNTSVLLYDNPPGWENIFGFCDETTSDLIHPNIWDDEYILNNYDEYLGEEANVNHYNNHDPNPTEGMVRHYYFGWYYFRIHYVCPIAIASETCIYEILACPTSILVYESATGSYSSEAGFDTRGVEPFFGAIFSVPTTPWNTSSGQGWATVNVTASPGLVWNVSSNSLQWLTITNITPANRTGSGSFRMNVATNNTSNQRTGMVTASASGAPGPFAINVNQAAPISTPPAVLDLSPSGNWNPTSAAQSRTIDVRSNRAWTVSSNSTWLSLNRQSGTNNGSFTITAASNTGAARSGRITVTGGGLTRTIDVNQGAAATLQLNINSWAPGNVHSSTNVTITSNTSWNVSSSHPLWLSATQSSGSGTRTIGITAQQNGGTNARTGTITVMGGGIERRISVTQAGQPTMTLNPSGNWAPTSALQERNISVNSSVVWDVTSNSTSWLTVPSRTNMASANGSFTIRVATNSGSGQRTGVITVSGQGVSRSITVTQAAAPTLTINPDSWNPTATPGSSFTTVTVRSSTSWTVSRSHTWITLSNLPPINHTGDGSFRIGAVDNTTTATRTGTVTVATRCGSVSRIFTVTQAPPSPTLNLSPSGDWRPSFLASSQNIGVTSNRHWSVSSSDQSWLRFDNVNVNNGSFRITTTQSTSQSARTGTITVTTAAPNARSATISVTQGGVPTLVVEPLDWNVGTAVQTMTTISVRSNTNWFVCFL